MIGEFMNRYSKRFAALSCVVCLLAALFCSGFTFAYTESGETLIPVFKDGAIAAVGTKLDDTTYVPVRAFCAMMTDEAEISWDQETETVSAAAPGIELTAKVGENYITANGRPLYVEDGVLNLDGTVVVPVRVIARAFGAQVEWNEKKMSISITVDEDAQPIEAAEEAYDEDDLYWLSHLIYAESGNQPLEGMIAVGNVVLNRVESDLFPDTIYGVISQYGQFDVFSGGTIYLTPNELSVVAAMICLDGTEVIEDGLFFVNPEYGGDRWFKANLTYITSIEDHDFYA